MDKRAIDLGDSLHDFSVAMLEEFLARKARRVQKRRQFGFGRRWHRSGKDNVASIGQGVEGIVSAPKRNERRDKFRAMQRREDPILGDQQRVYPRGAGDS